MAKTRPKNPKHGAFVAVALKSLNQAELAARMDVAPALVSQWANDKRPIAPKHAARFEEVTGGLVTREQLHPDVFGQPGEAA